MKAILYARVTTSDQREASLDDQLRECEELCKREGFTVVGRESDHGMSGESTDRPGYQRVLQAIESGAADVVVAHELSRLWRSPAEQAVQVEQFEFRGRHVVTCDGADTRRDGFEFLFAVKGAQSKTETKRIATRVHRTHKGLVLAGRSTGGRTYGYKSEPIYDSTRTDAYGRPEIVGATRIIDADAAEVVRRIFAMYADGISPRRIAARLNVEAISSPGAAWRRKTRRTDGKWLASAIHGDPKRGSGILNNELYIGRVVWNRRQMKKRPRTSKRIATMRTAADQVMREEPSLRIISEELWQRVKERQAKQAHELGKRVIGGLRKRRPGGGRPSQYMLSGLLQCAECEAGFVLSNGLRYQCASHVNGGAGACAVNLSLPRALAEEKIISFARTELFNPDRLAELEAYFKRCESQPVDHSARLSVLEREERNLTKAIKGGGDIPALLDALKAVQAERAKLQASIAVSVTPRRLMEPAERRAQRVLEQIEAGGDVGREALQRLFPRRIQLERDSSGRHFVAVFEDGTPGLFWDFDAASLAAFGTAEKVGNNVVAGAGFEPATFGL